MNPVIALFCAVAVSSFGRHVDAFVNPHTVLKNGISRSHGDAYQRDSSSLQVFPWMVGDILVSAVEETTYSVSFMDSTQSITSGLLAALVITMVPVLLGEAKSSDTPPKTSASGDGSDEKHSSVPLRKRGPRSNNVQQQGGLGRRGTLMALAGGAISFAASDMLLGTAGTILTGGGAGSMVSSVYEARWFGLFQRVAQHRNEYEAAAASPELLAWISTTPAAFSNPELRAWVAAQRAFNKGRQAAIAAAALEEGIATAGFVAVTAASRKQRVETSEDDEAASMDGEKGRNENLQIETVMTVSIDSDGLNSPEIGSTTCNANPAPSTATSETNPANNPANDPDTV